MPAPKSKDRVRTRLVTVRFSLKEYARFESAFTDSDMDYVGSFARTIIMAHIKRLEAKSRKEEAAKNDEQ